MVNRSTNLTSAFMKQGKCDSSFPTLDGSCNHPTEAGRSMQAYKETMQNSFDFFVCLNIIFSIKLVQKEKFFQFFLLQFFVYGN